MTQTSSNQQIFNRMRLADTLLCVGLDPDLRKFPSDFLEYRVSNEEKVVTFLEESVDRTSSHVCAYKVQKAFFDLLSGGHDVLKHLVAYIHTSHPGIPVIADCKIGDIENTMDAYIENIFNILGFDGVVANPYMGDDVMKPLAELKDKSIVALVKTSNPSGGIVQDVELASQKPLWSYILDLVVQRWNYNSNMVPVLASTVSMDLKNLRSVIPNEMPILLAGVGAQGGGFSELTQLLNSERIGPFVNSSRGILYPGQTDDWGQAIEDAAVKLKTSLNRARRSL